jgi:hypothetical protein
MIRYLWNSTVRVERFKSEAISFAVRPSATLETAVPLPDGDLDPVGTGVASDVSQGLLCDAEEARARIAGSGSGDRVQRELHGDRLVPRELLALRPDRLRQTRFRQDRMVSETACER